jgi:hydroxymethylpyrimidine pyrophosphatase-like HAD family hydrolase
VYIRFSHSAYNKGTALAEIARRLQISPSEILAAGDHYNDLPMLTPTIARWLVAPANAIPLVQQQVLEAGGYVSKRPQGEGVAQGIEFCLEQA